jgi:hypothetical protein
MGPEARIFAAISTMKKTTKPISASNRTCCICHEVVTT